MRIAQLLHQVLAAIVFVLVVASILATIGFSAYELDQAGHDTRREWWLMIPAALGALAIGGIGALWFERHGRRWQRRDPAMSTEDWRLAYAVKLARRREELAEADDPARRRYVQLIDKGFYITDDEIDRREARLRAVAHHPLKAKYADRIFHGEPIGPIRIAYWEDKTMLLTCNHLRPIERDLRKADPDMWAFDEGANVSTSLDLDWDRIRRRYGLIPTLAFQPGFFDDRAGPEGPRLVCKACRSAINGGVRGTFPA